jgi:hypothetical protein
MRGFVTILKLGALTLVLGLLVFLVYYLQHFQEEFRQPTGLDPEAAEHLANRERIGFEPGQYEFNRALELLALGEIDEARQKLLLIENLYPDSLHAPEARRILGNINLDEILSVGNMANKKIHRVAPGEGYLRIANANDTTLDAIMFLNGLTEFDSLHVGDELVVMPLNFKLVIDLSRNRVELYHPDHEKKEHVFTRDYPILKSTWNARGSGSRQLKISRKSGELGERTLPPTHPDYRHARKVLGIRTGNAMLQLRPLPEGSVDELPRALFLAGPDMEELAMLMRIGNEVELKWAG